MNIRFFFTIVIFILPLLLNCSKPDMQLNEAKKTYVVVVFDVEDYITPKEEGIDEIPKWLAEIMTEEGVTGTFFVIGEKARSLEERGRGDVIEAMVSHDIGSHTNLGSIHPTVTERLEKLDWQSGVDKMLADESKGFEELERIFNVPVSAFARHGGSYGPQLVHALGKMGKGYVYSPVRLAGHNAVWFCNTLNFHGEYGGFDDAYYKDELFNPLFDSLQVWFPELVKTSDVISFFGCHPCKVRTEQFWDFNYYKGANPDSGDWRTPDLRPLESMETAQKNFRRLMKYLKSRNDIEITTYSHLMNLYSKKREIIAYQELKEICRKIIGQKRVIIDDYFSPAEIFAALSESLKKMNNAHIMPEEMEVKSTLGPLSMPPEMVELDEISIEAVFDLAAAAFDTIASTNFLPAQLESEGKKIGTGSLLHLFSSVYLDVLDGKLSETYSVLPFEAFPKTNEAEIIQNVEDCKNWPVHREDLDMSKIIEYTRLQLWTLKPAHPENILVSPAGI